MGVSIVSKTLPPMLYKYKAMDEYTKQIISRGEVYFSMLHELNDPFEYYFNLAEGDYFSLSEQEIKLYQPEVRSGLYWLNAEKNTQRFIVSMRHNMHGVFCLSEHRNNIHMYAHYADNFKGICIGFDSKIFKDHPSILPMHYRDEPYKINGSKVSASDWKKILTAKSNVFSQEREWRVIDIPGVLSNGESLLIIEKEPDSSKFSKEFSGFIYNCKSNGDSINFWYFDNKTSQLLPLQLKYWLDNDSGKLNKFNEMIKYKPKAPDIGHFTNRELLFLSQFPLGGSAPNPFRQPIGNFGPEEIKGGIREIIFGFNICKENVDFVLNELKGMQTRFYVAKPIIGRYKLEICPFNNYEDDIKSYQKIYGYCKI